MLACLERTTAACPVPRAPLDPRWGCGCMWACARLSILAPSPVWAQLRWAGAAAAPVRFFSRSCLVVEVLRQLTTARVRAHIRRLLAGGRACARCARCSGCWAGFDWIAQGLCLNSNRAYARTATVHIKASATHPPCSPNGGAPRAGVLAASCSTVL